MKPIAIFDVDGTIFRSSLTIELLKHLVRQKIFAAPLMAQLSRAEKKWLNREGHYSAYIGEVVKAYRKAILGKKKDTIAAASRAVIREQKFRTYRYTRHLLEQIRGRYLTIAISSSPLEIIQEYNKFLKFDKLYGWELGIDERGRYTGAELHLPLGKKKELIVRYAKNHGLSLKNSIGVGDTEADSGFLELVDRPIAFNPNLALARIAKKRGWTVVVERKDLILEFHLSKVKILKL